MILAKTGFAHKLNPNGHSDYVCLVNLTSIVAVK